MFSRIPAFLAHSVERKIVQEDANLLRVSVSWWFATCIAFDRRCIWFLVKFSDHLLTKVIKEKIEGKKTRERRWTTILNYLMTIL